jgi:Carboxypeptidase regulatory-like domain/TonB-dependent Receptor Plug Domain
MRTQFVPIARNTVVLLLVCAFALHAQSTNSQITGTITDRTGASVVAARIVANNVDTGVAYTANSNSSGLYTVPLLPPGNYRVDVTMAQFRPISRSGITLAVSETARIDFTLDLGSVTESIAVTAAAPLIDIEASSVSGVVDNRKITQLPLNGRNVYGLESLVTGAAPDNSGRIRFNGVRSRGNEILVDGVTQVPPETRGDPVAPPPVDSVQEFKISSSSYSAEFGSAAGGLVNVATRAGTNEFHGTLWEFLRNDKLNTRNFFAPPTQPKPVLRQNQYGLAGGGPVRVPHIYDGRNRTFFFADFEGTKVRSQTVYNQTVPTQQMRNGDLSQYLGGAVGTDALGRSVLQGQLYDPASTTTINGQPVRDPFPGDMIPATRINPIALKLLI